MPSGKLVFHLGEKQGKAPFLDKLYIFDYNEIENGFNITLAKANPIRYRGYYFDADTGLYYLNARYYSPELRRFLGKCFFFRCCIIFAKEAKCLVKILAKPDKFIFCIGVGVVGCLFVFSYMILNPILLLIPCLLFWLMISYFLCRKNYIVIAILQNKFIIQHMGKIDEIDFKDVDCIIEFSSETNTFRTKRYEIRMRCNGDSHPQVLEIENKKFSTWLLMHQNQFAIQKLVIYD